MPSQETYREDLFEFRTRSEQSHRQPLTDTVQWTLRTKAAAVIIDITPAAGGQVKHLLFAPSATPHRIFVSNLPSENPFDADAHHAMNDEDMSAAHFGAFYKLLMNEPVNKPLPELWRPVTDRKGAGMLRPVYCPPAMFSRQ